MPADEDGFFRAAGLAMVPWSEADVFELFEWHACDDQPNCSARQGQPCACSGIPWPSAAVQAAIRAAAPLIRADERAEIRAELLALAAQYKRGGQLVGIVSDSAAVIREAADRIAPDPKETT